MERQKQWLGGLCVILGAVIFGSMPLSANFLYAQDVTPMMLVFLRNTLSLPVLALLGVEAGRPSAEPRRADRNRAEWSFRLFSRSCLAL